MTSTDRLHFIYIVGILSSIIIALLTLKLASNQPIVGYISFALTLASILLALVAIVYAFVSNASLAQSIGGLHQAAADIRGSAASVDRLTAGLEREVSNVSAKVIATHDLVRSLSNPESPPVSKDVEQQEPLKNAIEGLVARSSGSGKVAMYAAAVSYKQKRPFVRDKLFSFLGAGNERYYWGWLLALDAVGLIDTRAGNDDIWTVLSYSPQLLGQIEQAAKEAPEVGRSPRDWSRARVADIDEYFKAPAPLPAV